MLSPKPNFTQFVGKRISERLSRVSMPVVVFFWCDWKENCRAMQQLIEGLVEKYNDEAVFYWVDVDEQGDICRELSVSSMPLVLILKDGKETVRFSCSSSREGIEHNLDELIGAVGEAKEEKAAAAPYYW